MTEPWFADTHCASLEVTQHRSAADPTVIASLRIDDADFIQRFMAKVASMPTDGPKMIKWGPDARLVDLVFACRAGPRTLHVFEGLFQTPSTGFNGGAIAVQSELSADIDALLHPALGVSIPKVQGLALKLDAFTLTFTGTARFDGAPATVSGSSDAFEVASPGAPPQKLTVSSGQLPPQPLPFAVGRKHYTLLTYQTPKRERLYPEHFQITK